jgi:hypothetical protein
MPPAEQRPLLGVSFPIQVVPDEPGHQRRLLEAVFVTIPFKALGVIRIEKNLQSNRSAAFVRHGLTPVPAVEVCIIAQN